MEITEIIKESFVFPSKDLAKLAVYIVFMIVSALLVALGFALFAVGITESAFLLIIGILILIAGLIFAFIIGGYQISIIKSGIDGDESAPQFQWKENLVIGIKHIVVLVIYYIIPTIITLIVAKFTNLFGQSYDIFMKMYQASAHAPANTTVVITNVVPQSALISLGNAMIITGAVAAILFIIFTFILIMGESRLANTGSIGEALNIPEAFRDIGRIGWGKVLAVVILIFVIVAVINGIINFLGQHVPLLGILSIIVTPYMVFFTARATGLLYSDIA